MVFNFIGPDAGQGFRVYQNGALAANASFPQTRRSVVEDTRLVIGRTFVDGNFDYNSLQMDELVLFNRALNDTEIRMLSI